MAWILLVLTGLFEVVGVIGINRWNEKPNVPRLLFLCGGFLLSFILLSVAMQSISMGTAYAIWTAIGTVGGALVGMLVYGESRSLLRIVFIAMVVVAAVGLKLIG